jgi:hypothetical protein
MVRRRKPAVKVTDETHFIRCAAGPGVIREEVWQDEKGRVVKFNLAFICPYLYGGDNGRVLGYDTAHGYMHRHYCGKVDRVHLSYEEVTARFYDKVVALKEREKLDD